MIICPEVWVGFDSSPRERGYKTGTAYAVSKGADNEGPTGLRRRPNIRGVQRPVRREATQVQNLLGIYIFFPDFHLLLTIGVFTVACQMCCPAKKVEPQGHYASAFLQVC